MSLWQRIKMIFRSKANKALDRAEDPREMLDYSYQRQTELLTKVRRGVADVATSRKRLELQVTQLEQQSGKLQEQAERAISVGREDLAREALTRKSGLTSQINDLKTQHAALQGEEEKLTLAQRRLQAKIEAFRTKKETIKATYTAAEAQTRINEAVSGIGDEMGDVGLAIQRAEDKTAQMQARAGAIDELIASGALDDVTAPAVRATTSPASSTRSAPPPRSRPSWPGSRPAASRRRSRPPRTVATSSRPSRWPSRSPSPSPSRPRSRPRPRPRPRAEPS